MNGNSANFKTLLGILIGLMVLSLGAGGWGIYVFRHTQPARAPYFGQFDAHAPAAGDFQLIDHNGAPWKLSDCRGNVVLVNFGFTRCANICPTTLANLAAAYRLLPPAAQSKVRVAFVSLDERDTPDTLKKYVPFFHESFIGLTGKPAEVGAVACAYGTSYRKSPGVSGKADDYMIDHSTFTTLVDPEGRSRILYRFEQLPESQRMANDILRILGMPPLPPQNSR